jgi:RNA-directed DNA polymerase
MKTMPNEGTMDGPTLETVLSPENLQRAWAAVKANAGSAGVDGRSIQQTEEHLRAHWEEIKAKLLAGTYVPAAVKAVDIPKANGGVRTLGVPTALDRLLQQAIHQVLSPMWEPEFSDHSHGFRPNRSAHDAVREAQGYVQGGKTVVVDIDLKSYFDEVNHDRLMHQLARKVRDKRLLRLIGDFLRAPLRRPDGSQQKRTKGTPQGGPLSPLLANIYLDPLDKELEKRELSFVRYADDVAIFVSSERAGARVSESVIAWIEKHLKVPVNREKSGSGPSGQSALLGFRLYEDGRVGIAPKAIHRMKERVRELWDARQNRTSKELRDQWQRYIRGWWNYFELADWRREVEDLSGWIRRHMRKCFWLRWRTPRGRINALRRLGVSERGSRNGYSRRGAWAMARHYVVNQALKNTVLERYGLTVPWAVARA